LEKAAPKAKFSRKTSSMNYERFMREMEQDMSAEGITDELRVRHIDNWFSGDALKLVQSKKNNDMLMDATTTLGSIKEILDFNFKEEKSLMSKKYLRMWRKGTRLSRVTLRVLRASSLNCNVSLTWPRERVRKPSLRKRAC
jgi:hypothetical protein